MHPYSQVKGTRSGEHGEKCFLFEMVFPKLTDRLSTQFRGRELARHAPNPGFSPQQAPSIN